MRPMDDFVSNRDIYSAGFKLLAKVNEIVNNGVWCWSNDWLLRYPRLVNLVVPNLSNADYGLVWRDRNNVDSGFSVATTWECIRPRANKVDWFHVVWFSYQIPRHAIHLWLVVKRKLKTQDTLRQWDVSSNTNLNLIMCPLCDFQHDSYDHLFFGCVFSSMVWDHVKRFTGLSNMPSDLNSIMDYLIPLAKMRAARNVISKLVFADSCYFIGQEQNNRLFMKTKRSQVQVIDIIKSTVRLKLLSCIFKKTKNVQMLFHLWKLPNLLVSSSCS
ncbi:reverse transcriptase domain, reverse transcriptase zinc-binding domain protein [Tanacetum coccineum]